MTEVSKAEKVATMYERYILMACRTKNERLIHEQYQQKL